MLIEFAARFSDLSWSVVGVGPVTCVTTSVLVGCIVEGDGLVFGEGVPCKQFAYLQTHFCKSILHCSSNLSVGRLGVFSKDLNGFVGSDSAQ
jgi:hypothetical protein